MARCKRCNKFMLWGRKSGYCLKCELKNAQEEAEQERKLRILAEKSLEEEKFKSKVNLEKRKNTKDEGLFEKDKREHKVNNGNILTESKINKKTDKTYISDEGFTLSDEQAETFEKLENSNGNFFVTGKAGTGKSVVLKYFVKHTKKHIAVAAPTGIAAINVQGQTIHSLFKLEPTRQDVKDSKQTSVEGKLKRVLQSLDVLVIDEISMVSSDMMDMIDVKLRNARKKELSFGGCQIIVFGDLYQLPPVVNSGDDSWKFLSDRYGSEFFFSSPSIKNNPFSIIELNQVYRQSDSEFIDILNHIRLGESDASLLEKLNERVKQPKHETLYITLTPTKKGTNEINNKRLNELPKKEYIYNGVLTGDFKKKDTPTDADLHLKVGAQVMMVRNDTEGRWVNGTAGIIEELHSDQIKVKIKGRVYSVDKETWEQYKYIYNETEKKLEKIVTGSFTQFPVMLAYAITIHKSQGQTFENVKIDYSYGKAFMPGQTYVALSRCKSLEGLYLESKLDSEAIKVSQEVIHFMKQAR